MAGSAQFEADLAAMFPDSMPKFEPKRTQTATGSNAGERDKKDIDTTKTVSGDQLVKFGQLLTGVPNQNPPLAPRAVGGAAQARPTLPQGFAPDINALMMLSKMLGGQ